ncbi:gem-associated protein 2 [Plakobranchus ocellatus]|uniref:Gem-associated protein 2 n=1 Tax=Plakobranchus ocellatus TaxID=259542 RepID=A0AAV3YP74_9GAST|nr:gem-associated protein 2 [Plakobranchus ocellatus]
MDFDDSGSSSDGPNDRAFHIDEDCRANLDPSIPPTSGNEYLMRVRREAQDCPKVVVANLDTSAFLAHQTVKVTEPGGLLPVPATFKAPMAWQRLQVAEFAAMRQKLVRLKALIKQKKIRVQTPNLPQAKDAENWCRLCFGRIKLKPLEPNTEEAIPIPDNLDNGMQEGTPPLLHIVAHMNQHQVTKVLEYHVNWLEATGFTRKQGRWFYALLANLQKPLTPEDCSWLRRLARLCSNIRASLESPEDPQLNELNLLICLVSRYFDQRDLADS